MTDNFTILIHMGRIRRIVLPLTLDGPKSEAHFRSLNGSTAGIIMGEDNRKVLIAAEYLKDAALDWYVADAANIAQWHQNRQNNNFDDQFIAYFFSKTKQNQWYYEAAKENNDGIVFVTSINGNLLKNYLDRQNWEPMVVINDDQN
ncbi:hypothetical protein C1645_840033 [Glomus cerebriforme]|uniref:Uncharacterized protein n=1 Tax=Glomus cerebriforme TaxID=658196 RepID=A0A397S4S6_9GLOM|nr:hypothetical protein C1645_840033 [Glomus cerebriforme]